MNTLMKAISINQNIFLLTLFVFGVFHVKAQATFCLRFNVTSSTSEELIVALEIQGSEGFNLGSSNLQFSFDDQVLSSPSLFSHTLSTAPIPIYQVPTVTTPKSDEVSFNIELNIPNFGDPISGTSEWTEVGKIRFLKTNTSFSKGLVWSYNGETTETVIFSHDQATQLFATNPSCLFGLGVEVLPVDLFNFDVWSREKSIELRWETAYEENCLGFTIQRSTNRLDFNDIGVLDCKNSPSKYSYIDANPVNGVNYYRLLQSDFDGTSNYSEIRFGLFTQKSDWAVHPNPVTDQIRIIPPSGLDPVSVDLLTLSGGIVWQDKYREVIDVSLLTSGTYILQIQGANFPVFSTLIIVE